MARTTTDIINQAIKENRGWEILLSVFAALLIMIGVGLIIWSMIFKNPVISVVGVVESALFVPALNLAARTRKDNIMLRMLEFPLSMAQTADEAAEMLQRVFEDHFLSPSEKKKRKTVKALGKLG